MWAEKRDRTPRIDGGGGSHRIGHERAQLDRVASDRTALIETRQQQQVVYEHGHSLGFVLYAPESAACARLRS